MPAVGMSIEAIGLPGAAAVVQQLRQTECGAKRESGAWLCGGNADRLSEDGLGGSMVAHLGCTGCIGMLRGNVIERSGFALMPGEKSADSDVARACAETLSAATPKT